MDEDSEYKTHCPCCPVVSASGRSDNIRRHCQLVHKVIPWDYCDTTGFQLNRINDTLGIKYHPMLKKYGTWGFCFKCGTHIACGMANPTSKLATIKAHTCAQKKTRERKVGGVSASTPKRAMTGTGTATIEDVLKRLGCEIEFNDDLQFDLEATIRQNKGGFGKDSLWNDLTKSEKVGKAVRDAEAAMRAEHADDEDLPPFSPLAVIEGFIASEGRAMRAAQMANRKVADLRNEKDKLEDEIERLKLLMALSAAAPVAPPESSS